MGLFVVVVVALGVIVGVIVDFDWNGAGVFFVVGDVCEGPALPERTGVG